MRNNALYSAENGKKRAPFLQNRGLFSRNTVLYFNYKNKKTNGKPLKGGSDNVRKKTLQKQQ